MKIPGFDPRQMQKMMQEAQKQQDDMQKKLKEIKVDASVGGGIVSVVMSGAKDMLSIKIDPDAVKDGDVEMLQDLIVAAVNEASRKADEKGQEVVRTQLGGLFGGLGGLF
ncbi:MAG: YbaB/EbfC family nucleoid-associated protein [Blastocatellia bacterium]|nr:YbaB/EbfC family nucleoid-associated protein [Blastocatellia bacterium]